MTSLFLKSNIDHKPIAEYASWFLNGNNLLYNHVQLPPIQRNTVWDSNQIELLWDSILRGFPIGSFLLSPRKKGEISRSIYSKEQFESQEDGYFLLDGQQRTRAILLAFKPTENSRLWIDLDPVLSFDNPEYNDRAFLFRLLTRHQPWGMNAKNPKEKLSEFEKYQARTFLYGSSVRYDYLVSLNLKEGTSQLNEKQTWPLHSNLPVPFDSLVNLCGGYSGIFVQPEWSKVCELIPERKKTGHNLEEPPENFYQITDSLKKLIDYSSMPYVRAVSFLKQDEITRDYYETPNAQDEIEVLFRRINTLGTPLTGDELSFSLLKSSWDMAYDLVARILYDESVGYLFTSTGFVMAAARLARFNLNMTDDPNPGVAKFRKWIREKETKGSFLEEMKNLLLVDEDNSRFHSVLSRFSHLVLYRGKDDIGFPRKLLLSIKPVLIHPLLIWLLKNDEIGDEGNRKAFLRYLMFSLFCLKDGSYEKASKIAVQLLKEASSNFPDNEIYQNFVNKGIAFRIPKPEQFVGTLDRQPDGFLRDIQEIIGYEFDDFQGFRSRFWYKKELLLWYQRNYCMEWFRGYNPMSKDSSDTPFDYDHIVPYSHLILQGKSPIIHTVDIQLGIKFSNNRGIYMNSIGNLRIWPGWANRTDGGKCHTIKLRMNKESLEIDEVGKELGFKSNLEFLTASVIDTDDLSLWHKAGGNPLDWNETRRNAWQQAVENRVKYLFTTFYNSFGFAEWQQV